MAEDKKEFISEVEPIKKVKNTQKEKEKIVTL